MATDKLTREFESPLTLNTLPKPRCWSFLKTEAIGQYKVILETPDMKQSLLTEISVTVPKDKIAVISVRASVGLADKPEPIPVEVEL